MQSVCTQSVSGFFQTFSALCFSSDRRLRTYGAHMRIKSAKLGCCVVVCVKTNGESVACVAPLCHRETPLFVCLFVFISVIGIYSCCLYNLSMDSEMLCCSIWYEWVLHPASHKICKNNAITLTVYKVPGVNVLVTNVSLKNTHKKKDQPI